MNEVTPWISDYFINLATTYGSSYNTAPSTEKVRRCQLKKVLTSEPKECFWVVLSDGEHEVPGRIPKEVVDQCVRDARRDEKFTRHTGSVIGIRDFTPLFIRVEDGPSTSATRKVLALEIKKVKLCGSAGESTWGSPQPLDTIPELKQWVHELRKPDGNRDVLKIRKQQDDAMTTKQVTEPSPGLGLYIQKHPSAVAAQEVPAPLDKRSPMQRYRRKWRRAVTGLDEFAHRLQIPEDVRLKILEKGRNEKVGVKPRSSVLTNRPPNIRGALEIGSSPARLSSVPRATTPEEWPTSPGVLKRLYDNRETDASSDVDSSRPSSPTDVYHDAEMNQVEPQPESVPETPQIPVDSQTQHPSPPPPAQPPRPRSPLPSSSNPMQNHPTSPGSIHTSVQAVSGSQLPSENPPGWARSDDEPSGGPNFVLPWTQRDDPRVQKPAPEAHPTPDNQITNLPSPTKEVARPVVSEPRQEKGVVTKRIPRALAFGESIFQAIEQAFQPGGPAEAVLTTHDPSIALPAPGVAVPQLTSSDPHSKPPSKAAQSSLPEPSPSPLDRLAKTDHLEPPIRRPFEMLNRKVPVPEVGPIRELVIGRSGNGAPTMILVPASDDTGILSPLKQSSSSQRVRSSQSIPSSQPPKHLPPSQPVPSFQPQIQPPVSQPEKSIAQDGDSLVVQVNETVADIEEIQDLTGNTQSSLEYASTQDENKAAVDAEPPKSVVKSPEVLVVTETDGVADEPLESPLPQITAIRDVESQQSAVENEEVDELEDDSGMSGHDHTTKRKPKPASKLPGKATKHPKRGGPTKLLSSSKPPSKPTSRADSTVEKIPSRSSSKLPPKPVVVIEQRRTPVVSTDDRAPTAQKRRLSTPSEGESPGPQPVKRGRIHEHGRPARTVLSPIPRTPSPLQEGENATVLSIPRSAKGKERAEGVKGLENISASKDVERGELEVIQVLAKKNAPDTGSKRKPSDAFSARDESRDIKRQKVVKEPEPRKPRKQLSFVDPDKLKLPLRKPQSHKTSARHETTATATPKRSTVAQPDKDERTSKYFNPQLYREPEFPRMTSTPETEPPQRDVGPKSNVRSREVAQENGRDHGDHRPRIDPWKAGMSNSDRQLPGGVRKTAHAPNDNEPPRLPAAPTRTQRPKPVKKDVEKDSVVVEPRYPPARKLGSFAPDLNPPPLPGLPGGRLMNKQLREILIRTGRVRVKEAKAAE